MANLIVPLGSRSCAVQLGEFVREARLLIGWTEQELGARAGISQSAVSRIENDRAAAIDLLVVERLLVALGARAQLHVDARHLADRRHQRDGLHARLNGFQARRLEGHGWLTATEVEVGDDGPRGWIDLLAYRPVDRALIVDEAKTDIPDMGGLQRSVGFYERQARAAANGLAWRPTRVVVVVVALDTARVADRLRQSRDLVAHAFPSPVDRLAAWITDPTAPAPFGWTLATCDPASRGKAWLRPTTLGGRRRPPRYMDYADAARRLRVVPRPRSNRAGGAST